MSDTTSPNAASGDDRPNPSLRSLATATLLLFLLWLLLTDWRDPGEWLAGIAAAALTAWLSGPHLRLLDGLRLRPALPWHLLRFLGTFLLALIKANFDMARRVLSPRLPIRPALVEVKTELRSPLGRLLLANSITLTPGTLSVDLLDDRIVVHWIDVTPGGDLEHATREIAEQFELRLREVVE